MIIPILPPIEDIVALVDGAHDEAESVDADDEHVVQDEASELPPVVQALEDDSELKRSYMMCPNPYEECPRRVTSADFETTLERQNTFRGDDADIRC